MEIITQTLNTKDMTVRLIADTLTKMREKKQETGKINLSLDLTRPEYIQITMVGKTAMPGGEAIFAHCQYVRGTKEIYNTNISLDPPSRQVQNITSMLTMVSEIIDEEQFEQKCYEAYQLEWMISHGYSLNDLYNAQLKGMKEMYDPEDLSGDDDIDEIMAQGKESILYQDGFGNGEIFVCKDEFLNAEYRDPAYMNHLLGIMPFSEDMKKKYEWYTKISLK